MSPLSVADTEVKVGCVYIERGPVKSVSRIEMDDSFFCIAIYWKLK